MDVNKKVAIVTYDMIPYTSSWGGCQRMYYLAECLTKDGYDVTVFHCKSSTNNSYGKKIHFKIKSLEVNNRFLKRFLDSRNLVRKENKEESENKCTNMLKAFRKFVKQNVFLYKAMNALDSYLYNEPVFLNGLITLVWVKEHVREITEYIHRNHIKTVIISVPAFHLLSIGKYVKNNCDVRLIYDYRDPWNLWKRTSKKSFRDEKKYISYADKIVCTNEYLADDMSKEFSFPRKDIAVIANGFSASTWEQIEEEETGRNEMFTISYVGTIEIIYDGIRNIKSLIDAYREISKVNKRIKLRFIGVNDLSLKLITELKQEFQNIEFIGTVQAMESYKYILTSDVLLLLHTTEDHSSRYIISGKFYDYLRAGKPILSIGSSDGIHKKLIDDYKIGISVNDDSREIQGAIHKMYVDWENDMCEFNTELNVEKFSREFQNEYYKRLIQ